jgi:hypothetical protein
LVLEVEKVLVLPFLLLILLNLVIHPGLELLQSLVLLFVQRFQVIQVVHQNLDLPSIQEVQINQESLTYF